MPGGDSSNLPGVTRIARYAWFTLVFNVGVILLGALVRATGSGAGCGRSWPTCQGEVIPELSGATAIEFMHRAASGSALVLVAILVVWVWRRVPAGDPARTGAALSLAAIVGEALIGAMIVLAEWVAAVQSAAAGGKSVDEATASIDLSAKYPGYKKERYKNAITAVYAELGK